MNDERALIARLEAANTQELAELLLVATAEEEKVLRIYLGDTCFRRLRNLVLRREMARSEWGGELAGNVVFIPGVLGSELTAIDREQIRERIWLSPLHIIAGHLNRLKLDNQGLAEADSHYVIRATGIMKRYYGELILSLAECLRIQAFWYDWRKDFRLAAAELQARIDNWFPAGEPVHLVAHAEGGLVARAYIRQFPQRWNLGGSKLIMIGTPNLGLYSAPQALTGHLRLIQWLDQLDTHQDRSGFRELIKSFPSLYQLLPAPTVSPEIEHLYEAETFGVDLNVSQIHLDKARSFHRMLAESQVDGDRMIYIAGHNQDTYVGLHVEQIKDFSLRHMGSSQADNEYLHRTYQLGMNGDGTVPHSLGVLIAKDGEPVPAFYVEALHGDLCSHPQVLRAIKHLLWRDKGERPGSSLITKQIFSANGLLPLSRGEINQPNVDGTAKLSPDVGRRTDEQRNYFSVLVRRVNVRSSDERITRNLISVEEREIEERLTHGFLSGNSNLGQLSYQVITLEPPKIKINLIRRDITDTDLEEPEPALPIDTVAFGHYSASKPYGILRVLDYKLSMALAGVQICDADENEFEDSSDVYEGDIDDADLLLTQYAQRGTIRGDLGQIFLLTDPRRPQRTVAIAGMGEPGRFGVPELTLLARELCWVLGRMGKRHLATVLVGTGRDNLSVNEAVTGWIRGIKLATSGITDTDNGSMKQSKPPRALAEITFFMADPRKMIEFDRALLNEKASREKSGRMMIEYTGLTKETIDELEKSAFAYVQRQMERQYRIRQSGDDKIEPTPTRITVSLAGNTYRFGAITDQASIPEREIPLDPALVRQANDELAAAADPARQLDLGQFMQRLLIPADLRGQLITTSPLVMMLDAATARIHWELLAQSDLRGNLHQRADIHDERRLRFLGTSRGFTRQLRTVYAPLPEPPPLAQRQLRVLIVADPAADAHLPGAEEEGIAVAELFEQFNIVHAGSSARNRVEIVRLFGPREATRTSVLRHLMMHTYDVLHFAGHCVYDEENPAASGWIFTNGERLSAYEFTRVDRSPAFVFSNACESGLTPARSDERSVDLAPSFAEAFFARGVANFVCTAWPVEDRAAREFALVLYAGLLGLERDISADSELSVIGPQYTASTPLPMYQAMQNARNAIAALPYDVRTWGAYQHYGNPYYRFFTPSSRVAIAKSSEKTHLNQPEVPNGTGEFVDLAGAEVYASPKEKET